MASPFAIRNAAHHIRYGGIIVYPTDTVYGLGCDPLNFDAVTYLNTLKQRESGKGLILIANKIEFFNAYIKKLSKLDKEKVCQTETPTSWVVVARNTVPDWLTGNQGTLAIRITQHPVVNELCNHLRHPLVSSSANPSSKKPAKNALQIHKYFHNKVHSILVNDNMQTGQPSSIRYLQDNLILRT